MLTMNESILQAKKMVIVIFVKLAIELQLLLENRLKMTRNHRPNLELRLPSCFDWNRRSYFSQLWRQLLLGFSNSDTWPLVQRCPGQVHRVSDSGFCSNRLAIWTNSGRIWMKHTCVHCLHCRECRWRIGCNRYPHYRIHRFSSLYLVSWEPFEGFVMTRIWKLDCKFDKSKEDG